MKSFILTTLFFASSVFPNESHPFDPSFLLDIPLFFGKDLNNIKVVQLGGYSNLNYLLDEKYVLKIPGKGSSILVNKENELTNFEKISQFSFVPKLEYFDTKSGLQVTSYVHHSHSIDVTCVNTLEAVAMLLRKVHMSGCRFQGENCFSKINDYFNFLEATCPNKLDCYSFFIDTYSNLSSVLQRESLTNFPTHGDATPGNFLATPNGIMLLDWEYSAPNDPAWDLAYFAIESGINRADLDRMLHSWAESGEEFNDIRDRVFLYEPIVELVICLWADIQLVKGNFSFPEADLKQLKEARLTHCRELTKSLRFKKLLESF